MNIEVYKKEYDAGKSIKEIADQFQTYPNKIRRMFIKAGYTLRSHSEAQKLALETGKSIHPTEGVVRDEATKLKISESVGKAWDNISSLDLDSRKKKSKQAWEKRSESDKKETFKLAAQAVSKAGREGSKIEKIIQEGLRESGYNVIFHKEGLVENVNLQLDLFIPELKLAVEIDGPSHFLPIWGEEKLQKKVAGDLEKNGLLLKSGYSIIRVKCMTKNMTKRKGRNVLNFILNEIKLKGEEKNFYSEIEVS